MLVAHWTVLNEGNNLIKLYSGTNYLALINGVTQIVNIVSKEACNSVFEPGIEKVRHIMGTVAKMKHSSSGHLLVSNMQPCMESKQEIIC